MIIIPKLLTDFAEFLKHCSLFTLVYSTHPPESVFDTIQQQLVISSPIRKGSQSLRKFSLRACLEIAFFLISLDFRLTLCYVLLLISAFALLLTNYLSYRTDYRVSTF